MEDESEMSLEELINKRDSHKYMYSEKSNESERRYHEAQINELELSIARLNDKKAN